MWTRKHLKHQAKKSLKSNYQKMVSVCFLIAFLTTSFASSTFIFRQFRPGLQTIFVQTHLNFPDASNSSIATDTLQHVFQISFSGAPLATLFEHILNIYTSGRSIRVKFLLLVHSHASRRRRQYGDTLASGPPSLVHGPGTPDTGK